MPGNTPRPPKLNRMPVSCSNGSGWPNACITSPRKCRAGSSSGWRLPARWSTAQPALGRRTDWESRLAHERRDPGDVSSNSTPRNYGDPRNARSQVASYAHRVFTSRTAKVERDQASTPPAGQGPATPAKLDDAPRSAEEPRRRWRRPSLFPRTFRTAFSALRRNKMRSALTTLGVVIGVSAVIAMMEIGQGSKTAMQKTIAPWGRAIFSFSRERQQAVV